MPKFKTGNMWDAWEEADLFLITTNSTIKKNGALVMGAGIAKEARDMFPGLDLTAGQRIKDKCGNLGLYYLLISDDWPNKKLGLFQVKTHYSNKADIEIIRESTWQLAQWATHFTDIQIHLNYPGIGNGGLSKSQIEPIIITLPDNVTIWEK